MKVSVIIITLNEENNIAGCLESVAWAAEKIVVDAESTDRTVEIAGKFTDRVVVRPWPGFGPQKNFGMEQAVHDWILIVDADERVTPELRSEIEIILDERRDGASAYRIPRRNFFYGRWIRWCGAYPDYQIRLVKRGAARYNDVPVHENLLVQGPMGTLAGHLDHHTERRIGDHFRKFHQYTTLAAELMRQRHRRVYWFDFLARPITVFLKTYLLKQGFRDGIHGLIICGLASMYTFVKYAKLWERLQQR